MHKLFISFTVVLFGNVFFAISQNDWGKVRALEREVRYQNPSKFLDAAQHLEFTKKEDVIYKEWLTGLHGWYYSNYIDAYTHLNTAYQESRKNNEHQLTIEIALDLAKVYAVIDQTGRSLTLLLDLDESMHAKGSLDQKARYYLQLAELYRKINEFDKAFSHVEHAKEYITDNGELRCYYYNRKAAILTETLQHAEAKKYSYRALKLAKKLNHPDLIGISSNELAYLNRHTKQQDSVAYYYKMADSVWSSAGLLRYAAEAELNLSIQYSINPKIRNPKKAKSLALEISKNISDKGWDMLEFQVYEHLTNLYQEFNQIDSSHYYKSKSFDAYIRYLEKRNEVVTAIVEGEFAQKKNEALIREQQLVIDKETQLKQRIQSESRLYLIIIVISILTIALLSVLARLNYKKRLKAIEIAKKELELREELEQHLAEKNILLAEVNHRVKNNLQTMSTLLDLQRISEQSPVVKTSLMEAQRRIDAMGIVHEMLYSNEYMNRIDLQVYINNLIESERTIYDSSDKTIQFRLQLQSIKLDINRCISLGMIISEFIANSFKHAFHDVANPKIQIELTKQGKTVELILYDNGSGIKSKTTNLDTESLGLKLISIFCKKLSADYHLTGQENGTRLEITFLMNAL